jgi:hypothetical protein
MIIFITWATMQIDRNRDDHVVFTKGEVYEHLIYSADMREACILKGSS